MLKRRMFFFIIINGSIGVISAPPEWWRGIMRADYSSPLLFLFQLTRFRNKNKNNFWLVIWAILQFLCWFWVSTTLLVNNFDEYVTLTFVGIIMLLH